MDRADARQRSAAQRIVAAIFGQPDARGFAVRYWDGTRERSALPEPLYTLVVNHPGALRRMLLPPSEIAIVEAYLSGDMDVEGDLEAAIRLGDEIGRRVGNPVGVGKLVPLLLRLPRRQNREVRSARFVRPADSRAGRRGGAAAIRHHYDVGNDFYELWLDREMQYSCAYFSTGDETIHEAQLAKLEHICRKLRLRPGERLLDIGCGWGGLIRYAASRYGVIAHGITLSEAQAGYARERIAREGLGDTCTVDILDYRDLTESDSGRYDKVVSVGMAEHVAPDAQPAYFAALHRALAPGGLLLNHCIVSLQRTRPRNLRQRLADRLWRRNEFIERYVFPDGQLVPVAQLLGSAESTGFHVRDMESLREHYALTLRHWLRRLDRHEAEAKDLAGERIYRTWKLYMSTGAEGFSSGRMNIVQTLLSKPDAEGRSRLPLTREDLYRAPVAAERERERMPAA